MQNELKNIQLINLMISNFPFYLILTFQQYGLQQYKNNNNKMELYQQVEFLVYLRQIKTLKFWYKGQYSLNISIFQQAKNGEFIQSAYPHLINAQKTCIISPGDVNKQRSKTLIQNNKGYYQTKIFDVYFESEKININDQCIFKLQHGYQPKKDTNVCLNIDLIKNKKVAVEQKKKVTKLKKVKSDPNISSIINKQNSSIISGPEFNKSEQKMISKTVKVASKKFYVNPPFHKFDEYCLPLFSDNQYFSVLYMYIGSVHLGWKLRKINLSICTFICLTGQERQKIMRQKSMMNQPKQIGKALNKARGSEESLEYFYDRTVVLAKKMYRKIKKRLQKLMEQLNEEKNQDFFEIYAFSDDYLKKSKPRKDINSLMQFFKSQYDTADQDQLAFEMFKESSIIQFHIKKIWELFCECIRFKNISNFSEKCKQSQQLRDSKFYTLSVKTDTPLENKALKRKCYKDSLQKLIKQVHFYEQKDKQWPLMVKKQGMPAVDDEIKSKFALTVFVHGFQGTYYDLERAGNYYSKICPDSDTLIIKDLITSEGDLDEMGKFIAKQIIDHMKTITRSVSHINFIGYSLGGIIIRASMKYLFSLKSKMNIFVTFSTPHLGTSLCQNNFVKLGVWYMSKIQKVKSIDQINHERNFLASLCNQQSLSWFKKIILISSQQDQFSPYASSSISPQLIECQQIKQQANNFIKHAKCIDRLEIWFDAQNRSKTLDRLIGRKSHIQFIDNDRFLQTFFHIYQKQM